MIDPQTGETILIVIGVIAVFSLGGFFTWVHHRDCLSYIESDIGKYHPRDVKIRNDWMSQGRYNFTYDVEYRDTAGQMHYNRCTVSWDVDVDNTVTWDEPLDRKLGDPWPKLTSQHFH
jgi:hypothetical protein